LETQSIEIPQSIISYQEMAYYNNANGCLSNRKPQFVSICVYIYIEKIDMLSQNFLLETQSFVKQ